MLNRYYNINVVRTYVDFLIKNIFYFYVYTQIHKQYVGDIISGTANYFN